MHSKKTGEERTMHTLFFEYLRGSGQLDFICRDEKLPFDRFIFRSGILYIPVAPYLSFTDYWGALSLMDTVQVIFGVLRIILGFLLLVVIPGFAISLVIFPRLTDMSIIDRLVYTAVLGITSVIAFVMFTDLMPGLDLTLSNLTLIAGVFSAVAFMVWLCERWYLNRQLTAHPEPQVSEDSPDHQRYYSRELNAAKDQFRQDTRTVVIYHESERLSGMNFVSNSYLLDVGEEIDIQQVVENRVKGTERFILDSPYPKTRYFELIMLEHDEGPSSLVDDLQIYPVHVTTKPDTKFPGTTLQRDALLITERIYSKTSIEEVQWIYSHDFHIFAFIHAEDTLAQMVDRILGILDEIVIAAKSGVRITSSAGDRQILKSPFDAVSEKPRGAAVTTPEIPQRPEMEPVVPPRDTTRRPVILPGGQDEEIFGDRESEILVAPSARSKHPAIQTRGEPKEIPGRTAVSVRGSLPGRYLNNRKSSPVLNKKISGTCRIWSPGSCQWTDRKSLCGRPWVNQNLF